MEITQVHLWMGPLIECLFCQNNSTYQCSYFIKGALAWNGDMLSSGSRDRLILQRDARTPSPVERRLIGHRQEVRGIILMIYSCERDVQ